MNLILKTTIALILILSFYAGYTQPVTWEGTYSNNWSYAPNWSNNAVPNLNTDVIIMSGKTYYPYIQSANAVCKNLIIHSGASVGIGSYQLIVNNNLFIDGTLTMNFSSSKLEVRKDLSIGLGVFKMNNGIAWVGGNWTNSAGLGHFIYGEGSVIFNGTVHQYINSSENFNNLVVNNDAALRIDNASYTVNCNKYEWMKGGIDIIKGTFTAFNLATNGIWGKYYVNPGGTINLHQSLDKNININCEFHFNTGGTINIYGGVGISYWSYSGDALINMNGGVLDFKDRGINIYSSSHSFTQNITGGTIRTSQGLTCGRSNFTPSGGTFEFYGSADAYLNMVSGSHLYNVKINKSSKGGNNEASDTDGLLSGILSLASNIKIIKDLEISSGTLNAGSRNITISGDWKNNAGSSGFNSGSGRVIFNGTAHQYIKSSENFYILELDKEEALRVDSASYIVTCNKYEWKKGAIDVYKGTFTAYDLVNNGIYGSYYLNPGGTINLYQDSGQSIDLNGKFNFNGGGTINIYGGSGASYWSRGGNAEINMNGGTVDFKDQGIFIYNSPSYSFTQNLMYGSNIRTSQGLICNRADFQSNRGTFEFYGSSDASLYMVSGSNLYDVIINKSSKEGGESFMGEPVYDQRSGEMISEGGKANTITLASNLVATGNLKIEAGNFNLSSYTCNVKYTTLVFGKLIMNYATNDLTTKYMEWYNGSSANVTAGTFHAYEWDFRVGTTAKLGTGNTAYVSGLYAPKSNDAEFGNLVFESSSKSITDYDNTKTYYPVRVMGYMLIKSGADLDYSVSGSPLIVVGDVTIENGASISFSGADFEIGGSLNLAGKLWVRNNHTATIQGEFIFPSTGLLELDAGTFINNYNSGTYTNLDGKLTMNNNSLLEFPETNIMIGNTFVNEVSGGTLRFGKSLDAPNANNFQLDHGTVEFISAYPNHSVSVYNGNYLNDVVINKTGVSFIVYANLVIKNDLTIDSGVLSANDKTISIGGNWINNAGVNAFNEGTG
ncbi:MAG: hypothetical protein WBJ84_02015, partial [Bacteroidales bacterium]